MKVSDIPLGIVLDCSHMSALDLNLRIVDFAVGFGFRYVGVWPNGRPYSPDDEDYEMVMGEIGDEAVEWMNEQLPDGNSFFAVDENSLFHWSTEDRSPASGERYVVDYVDVVSRQGGVSA